MTLTFVLQTSLKMIAFLENEININGVFLTFKKWLKTGKTLKHQQTKDN